MNNLFYNALAGAQGQTYPFRNNVAYSRSGEPISVNGIESVNAFQTMPNTKTILFHATEPIFYCKMTDDNNYPEVKIYRYTEIKPTSKESQFVTIEEFNKFKEELINGQQQHIWSKSSDEPVLPTDGEQHSTSAEANEHAGSKSKSSTNAASPNDAESSIW